MTVSGLFVYYWFNEEIIANWVVDMLSNWAERGILMDFEVKFEL